MARAVPTMAETLAIMRHLADVAALKSDPAQQRQRLIDGLNDLFDTDCGFFYMCDDWAIDAPHPHFTHQTFTRKQDSAAACHLATFSTQYPLDADPFCYVSLRDQSPTNRWTLHDLLADGAILRRFDSIHDLIRTTRWQDGIVTLFRSGPEQRRVVGFSLHRLGARRNFSAREKTLAQLAVEELQRLHERGHLVEQVAAPRELPPRLRQVLDRLLAGRTPKSIARELGLSLWTVREHFQRLYRHFGVTGRDQLTARFTTGPVEAGGKDQATASMTK